MEGSKRLNVYLTPGQYEDMQTLAIKSGKRTMAGTIAAAMRLFKVCVHAEADGKQVCLRDKSGQIEVLVGL